jgi:hypothetical protein
MGTTRAALWLWAIGPVAHVIACSSPSAPPAAPAGGPRDSAPAAAAIPAAEKQRMITLSHNQITEAVAATGDPELAAWVEDPGAYATEPVSMSELEHHRLFRIMPDGVSHPMSFLVILDTRSGVALVTTGNAGALASVLAGEPALAGSPELAQRVFQLVREESRRQKLLRGPDDLPASLHAQQLPVFAPEATRDERGWTFRLAVLDAAGLLQHWQILVPSEGSASFEQKTVAHGLDVGDMGH